MQFQKKEKRQTTVRFDSHHVRLRTGEVQRKTGSYMYRWTDKLGKRNTIYAATLEDLREQEEQILVDQHDGIKANIKNVTVNDVYELWCQLKRGIKDSTMKNYIYMYELFVKPTFGKKKLVQVKKSDVRRFYNQLIDDKVLKPSTVDVIHNIVHQVFQIAVDDDMIRSNPAANMLREIKMAHGSEIEKRKALTLEQEELFLGYLARTPKYQHWYPVFYIMANTGMRVGEITGLRWCDVDMENGIISVNHTLVYYNHRDEKGCYFSINTPKTKAGIREIPMTEGVKQAFLMEKEFQEECGMKSVSHIEGYSDFVFVNRNGEVQHQGTLNKALQRIMRDCNSEVLEKKGVDSDPVLLPKFSCHVLRHTFATRMCESGLNVKVVQSVLGHADVTTTLDIYVTVTNDLKKREITAFETYLKRLKKDKWVNRSISCPEYVQSIYKMMNWNKECRYKIYGRLANSERGLVLVFDLASAVMFDPLPEEYFDKHTGKMKKRIVKYYPDEIRMKLGRSYSDYEALQQRSSFESLSGYMDTSGGAVPATVSEELAASISMQEQEKKRETLFGTIIGNGGDDDVRNNE